MNLLLKNIEVLKTAIYDLEDKIPLMEDRLKRDVLVRQLARADQLLMAYYAKLGEMVC